jgi:ribonuclease G
MSTDALYLAVDPFETRTALRSGGRLVAYRAERHRASSVVGNVYKGRVNRVLPGMQAAFVDIGLERDAFLYVREADAPQEELDDLFSDGETTRQAADELTEIEDLLREGQELLVQVVKDGYGSKGARLTTHITLPGRALVLLPTISQRGVSRRIDDEHERSRLRSILAELGEPGGWIVRTAGADHAKEDLERERCYLLSLWSQIVAQAERATAPRLVHAELSPVLRTVRDLFGRNVAECWVDDANVYREIVAFLKQLDAALVPRLRLLRRPTDLMAAFGIDRELEKSLRPKVWLKHGSYLVINQTEALVAIDVNTGKYTGSQSLEDTVYRTNLEAVREIVRQLRLRDLGGIIVIDFIDMIEPAHREAVYAALAEELQSDPARSQLMPMSDIGLIQLTRKRTRASLERTLERGCPYCSGSGRIKSNSTLCLEIRRSVLAVARRERAQHLTVEVHPEIHSQLTTGQRAILEELAADHGIDVTVRARSELHHEQYEILS